MSSRLNPLDTDQLRGERAKSLIQKLQFALDQFSGELCSGAPTDPEVIDLTRHVDTAIRALKREAKRRSDEDRNLVRRALFGIEADTLEGIIDETGLPERDVQRILDEFVVLKFVELDWQGRAGSARGPKILLYRWIDRMVDNSPTIPARKVA